MPSRLLFRRISKKILEEFHRIEPDLVLLDVNLPFFDGFYWCQKSASNPWYPFCLFRLVTVIWIKRDGT